MTVKPIDLQTNIAQTLEVGKGQHARLGAEAEIQQILDKKAKDKSNLANTRLDETDKGEKTSIKAEDKKKDRHGRKNENRNDGDLKQVEKEKIEDEKMGLIIDVLK